MSKSLTQKERILHDLLDRKKVDMLSDIARYGTSCRSRIAELREEGYPIEDEWKTSENGSRYNVYFLPKSYFEQEKVA